MGFEISVFKNGHTWDSRIADSGTPNGEIVIVSGGVESAEFEKPGSLNQANKMIEGYIEKCIADSRNEEIGGEVHMGQLTSAGFDWLRPPSTNSN